MFLFTYFHCFVIVLSSSMLNLLICCFILCCILFALLILHKTLLSGVRRLKGPRAVLYQSSDQHPVPLPCWVATRGLSCCGEATTPTYSECVSVALFIQHGKRMRRILLPAVACITLLYSSTLSHKRHDFQGKTYWI